MLTLACVGALVAGCGGAPTGTGTGPGSGIEPPQGGGATCESNPVVTDVAKCRATVDGLVATLRALLETELPGTAQLSNNLFDASGNVGGTGVVFVPRPSETGTDTYEAAVRIRDGERSANLNVTVERHHVVPADPQCRSEEMVADATSKGIVIVRCDRAERDDGTVVVTRADDYPYDQERSLLLPARSIAAYRPDGVMVLVSLDGQIESAKPAGLAPGTTVPSMLSVDQLVRIGLDPRMTVLA